VLLLAAACPGAHADIFDDLSSLDKDRYVHFGAGVLVSHVSYPVFKHYLRDKDRAMWYALGLTVALSVGKELYDADRTGFDGGDLAAGVLGGCTLLVVEF
jgi:uncharacterized membrane protein YjdF